MDKENRVKEIVLNGLILQNPILVLFLGMCATLAVSTSLVNALGMGLSTTAVLICSNLVISLLRKAIPKEIRIACYVVVIAGFVTIIDLCLQAFLPELSESLGLFIPLIVVNCIILGRAEAFASKETPGYAALDGLSMGLGFTLALSVMGFIRELLGNGAILGHEVLPAKAILIAAPCGGFLVLGCLVALANYLKAKDWSKSRKAPAVAGDAAPETAEEAVREAAQEPVAVAAEAVAVQSAEAAKPVEAAQPAPDKPAEEAAGKPEEGGEEK